LNGSLLTHAVIMLRSPANMGRAHCFSSLLLVALSRMSKPRLVAARPTASSRKLHSFRRACALGLTAPLLADFNMPMKRSMGDSFARLASSVRRQNDMEASL
jgi:hypothetical protein